MCSLLNVLGHGRAFKELNEFQGFVEFGRDAPAGEPIAIQAITRVTRNDLNFRKALVETRDEGPMRRRLIPIKEAGCRK